jgi:two-component system, NtrC family, nitrogen regulation sensor histidine kinase NtrY
VAVVEMSLEIFNEDFIIFNPNSEEIVTKIDKTQLIRIITNLIKNAIQAIPEEQFDKQIWVAVKEQSNNLIITIQDNGKGIPKEDFERIFEPKFTTKTSGMGLGLGIIKNIIENYNGSINFESQIGKGTTFTVSLPIVK